MRPCVSSCCRHSSQDTRGGSDYHDPYGLIASATDALQLELAAVTRDLSELQKKYDILRSVSQSVPTSQ